jgi:hypothetical protein
VDGKFLTFIVGIPGSKTHTLLRSLYSEDTLIYSENKNTDRSLLFQKFPNHVTYITPDGIKIPHMFDRMRHIENEDTAWDDINNRLGEIYKKYKKQVLIATHTPMNEVRSRYPKSTIYYIEVDINDINECHARHAKFKKYHWNNFHEFNVGYQRMIQSKKYADHIIEYSVL